MNYDPRGTEVQVHSRVAFNRSGDVVIGTVVALTYDKRFPAKIKADQDLSYGGGKVSTVKSPMSVLVLKEDDTDAR